MTIEIDEKDQKLLETFLPLADPVEWIEKNFYVPELRGPLQLAPYQRACLKEALALDPPGSLPFDPAAKFRYSLIVWSDLKKSIKSTLTAAVVLWVAHLVDAMSGYGQILIVANDLKQADSRVGMYLRRAVQLNPQMSETIKIQNYNLILPNGTRIESIPIDPAGEAGSNADMVVFSELWASATKAQQRMWTESTLSPTKFGRSFRWVESYAGFTGESILLEQLYFSGVDLSNGNVKQLDITDHIGKVEAFVNRKVRQFTLWNTIPRLPWQTVEYYNQERGTLSDTEFDRVHRNQWVSPKSVFVPPGWVDACYKSLDAMPKFDPDDPLVGALDAGTTSDNFGILLVSIHNQYEKVERERDAETTNQQTGDGERLRRRVIPRFVKKFVPPSDGKLDFREPEQYIREMAERYNVALWIYDPYQLHNLCTTLDRDGVGYFEVMSQNYGGLRAKADKQLYDIIKNGDLWLLEGDPDIADLAQHIKNAAKKREGEGIRIQKRSDNELAPKIDLAVCLSMATYGALDLNIG